MSWYYYSPLEKKDEGQITMMVVGSINDYPVARDSEDSHSWLVLSKGSKGKRDIVILGKFYSCDDMEYLMQGEYTALFQQVKLYGEVQS